LVEGSEENAFPDNFIRVDWRAFIKLSFLIPNYCPLKLNFIKRKKPRKNEAFVF